jgi:transcriptional regulator with XRE-family HTH domain
VLGFSLVMENEIRALRRRKGWTQAELASRLGTDPVTVSRWERGVSHPRPSARVRLLELSGDQPEISSLAHTLGERDSKRVLLRALLLAHRPRKQRFAEDPTTRLREIERTLLEQQQLKAGMRPVS